MEKVSLLILSSRPEDFFELSELLRGTSMELAAAANMEEASNALRGGAFPIVLLDRDWSERWQSAIAQITKMRRKTCVVLLSSVSDQYLWDETVQHGGFDILTRPFKKEQVTSTLHFAYVHARAPWPKIAT